MRGSNEPPLVLAIVGATATGKSAISLEIADCYGAEIISIDSVQVYRGMDIGSAKPSEQQRRRVRHHMIDIMDPWEELDVYDFREQARRVISEIHSRGKLPLLTGGSALYFTSITAPVEFRPTDRHLRTSLQRRLDEEGLDALVGELEAAYPEIAKAIDVANPRRVVRALEVAILSTRNDGSHEQWRASGMLTGQASQSRSSAGPAALTESVSSNFPVRMIGLGLTISPDIHLCRIRRRLRDMFANGFEDEVRAIYGYRIGADAADSRHPEPSRTASQALGYREVAVALMEGRPAESAIEKIISRTRQLARRQLAWFRRDARLSWISVGTLGTESSIDAARHYFDSRLASI